MAFHHLEYFNPDTFAARLIAAGRTPDEANRIAWRLGYDTLREAVDRDRNFTFETTLGGVTAELRRAMESKREVHTFYVGAFAREWSEAVMTFLKSGFESGMRRAWCI